MSKVSYGFFASAEKKNFSVNDLLTKFVNFVKFYSLKIFRFYSTYIVVLLYFFYTIS